MKNHIILKTLRDYAQEGESIKETRKRFVGDDSALTNLYIRVQNIFSDPKSLAKYIKNNVGGC